jgi:peptide deformylase
VPTYKIVQTGDPVLRKQARPLTPDEIVAPAIQELIARMRDTMRDAPGVGLAAPQIGLALRFFVYDAGEGSGPGCVANPVLSDATGSVTEEEGCLSIPKLYFPTDRAESIRIDGQDLHGEPISMVGTGHVARILQHETDHLNGMLFISRLTGEVRREALAAIRERELGAPGPRG